MLKKSEMKNILFLLSALVLFASGAVRAQTTPAELTAFPERAAGLYHSYEYLPGHTVPVPAGFEPFYISHYGRHGSRYHSSRTTYTAPLAVLERADSAGVLTDAGRDLLSRVRTLAEDARDREGDLTPRGAAEHRGIAERMYRAYPEVFSTAGDRACLVESRSTLVPRCILSMAAFNERLKELNPSIRTVRESSKRYLYYLSNTPNLRKRYGEAAAVADSLKRLRLAPARLIGTLFSDPAWVPDPVRFMSQVFNLASIVQDVSGVVEPFYDLFTPEECYALWECENVRRYLQIGPSVRFGDPIVADARPLLRNIVETARDVIEGRRQVAATLRFGHDVNLIPLAALLRIAGASARVVSVDDVRHVWNTQRISPMAANIQFVFFRNAASEVRVRILLNERDAVLPLEGGPYYPWKGFLDYCEALYE